MLVRYYARKENVEKSTNLWLKLVPNDSFILTKSVWKISLLDRPDLPIDEIIGRLYNRFKTCFK